MDNDNDNATAKPRYNRKPKVKDPYQMVVAHWPSKTVLSERIGDNADNAPIGKFDSAWISLRYVDEKGGGKHGDYTADISLWVYFSSMRDFTVTPKLHNVYSADLREAEGMLKALKAVTSKVPDQLRPVGSVQEEWEPLSSYIPRLLDALGIQNCVQYRPGADNSTIAPRYHFVEDFLRLVQSRITRFNRLG
jgi:hypothetical protein